MMLDIGEVTLMNNSYQHMVTSGVAWTSLVKMPQHGDPNAASVFVSTLETQRASTPEECLHTYSL